MRVAIVGAGLAGLSAGCELADRGHEVALFERRPWAGGKTYSFVDERSAEPVDNGQHIFMTCTSAYIDFLRKLGTLDLTYRQERLRVQVFDARGRKSDLYASRLRPPLHLAQSLVGYRHLSPLQKAQVVRASLAVQRMGERTRTQQHAISFEQWLAEHGQSPSTIRRFWDFIVLPTLNCRTGEASAADGLFVMREGFLKSPVSAAVGIPRVGLTELHVAPALRYIEARGGEVRLGTTVQALEASGARVQALRLDDGSRLTYDAYVLATPHRETLELLPAQLQDEPPYIALRDLPCAPIINLHFWLDRPVARFEVAAFVDSELQWVFNRTKLDAHPPQGQQEHLVVSLSGAGEFMPLTKRELQDRFTQALHRQIPNAREARILHFAAIKEPEATFVPAPGITRPPTNTSLANLFLAGAYTDTGWPATMESAVRSGRRASATIEQRRADLTELRSGAA